MEEIGAKNLELSRRPVFFHQDNGGQMHHLNIPKHINEAIKLFLDGKELHPQQRIDQKQLKELFRLKASQTHLEPEDAGSVFEATVTRN